MAARSKWMAPSFTRGEVDRASRLLVQNGVADALAVGHALDVINNWRSSHSFPLNTFQVTLRKRASSICGQPLVAQRLKRVPSRRTATPCRLPSATRHCADTVISCWYSNRRATPS